MKILKIIGYVLIAIGGVAILSELFGYSLLIYYGNPIGGLLGVAGIFLGVMLLTLTVFIPHIRAKSLHPLEYYIIFIDTFNEYLGIGVGWFTTLMVTVVFANVVLRYVVGQSVLALQDMSWYLFGVVFLVGAAYTLNHDRHVRVDIFYVNYPPKAKVWINLLGGIFFLIPFCVLGMWVSWSFVERSFLVQETSPDAGGLAARYMAKSMIPLGFLLILIEGLSMIFKSFLQISGKLPIKEEGRTH